MSEGETLYVTCLKLLEGLIVNFFDFCSIKDLSIVIKIETVYFSYVIVVFTKLPCEGF